MTQDIISTCATAVFVLLYCCLRSDHPLAPSLTTVITISIIQFHFLAFTGRPLAKLASKNVHPDDDEQRKGVVSALLDSISAAAKSMSEAIKENALARSVGAYVICISAVRYLRSYGFLQFHNILDVFIIAFPLGVISCYAMVGRKVEKPVAEELQEELSPQDDPVNESFWGDLPGADEIKFSEPEEQEWNTASVLAGVDELFPAVASAEVM